MAWWRDPWKRTGLLGIAIVACLALAACGTASGQTGAAAGVATTTPATSSSATATSGGMAGPGSVHSAEGSGQAAQGSGQAAQWAGQAAQGLGQAGNGPAQAVPGAAATRPKPRALALPATARPGDHGKGVAALQRQLATLGYEVRKVDGQYGSATQHAVVAFQKVNHLSRDGIAGPKTMKALAPEGSFRIGRKVNGWHRSYLGLMYRPAYFDGPYAIHGVPNVPPYPASHGCIRVTTASMDAIYSKLVPGTRVLVYRT